ncbi:hypothetical protein [Microvirga sp. VF16]|uniref:hypothetical protein n=1 Tax=Microvirga sp. VF16 TaxID=2807101 RepID=UPI00193EA72D|nr:hypothetical protein JO965_12970 [Microvirga sp. VF16]
MNKAVLGGISACYGVGISIAVLWVRRAPSGEVSTHRQGHPKGPTLDAHAAFLLELIDGFSHSSLHEMQARLGEKRGVSADIGMLWRGFCAPAMPVKKAHACEHDRSDVRAAPSLV